MVRTRVGESDDIRCRRRKVVKRRREAVMVSVRPRVMDGGLGFDSHGNGLD